MDPRHTVIACWAGAGLFSYLLGAVPFGLIVGRVRGIDVREVGSRNIGATNVFRSVGKPWGVLTFVLDFLKGLVPSIAGPRGVAAFLDTPPAGSGLALFCACCAIAGHTWPVYIGFKGGKGVATSAGGLVGVAPVSVLAGFLAWIVVFLLGRYVSVASMAAAAVFAAVAWPVSLRAGEGRMVPIVLTVLAALIIARHHGNVRRLLQGTEHRFSFRRAPVPAPPGKESGSHAG